MNIKGKIQERVGKKAIKKFVNEIDKFVSVAKEDITDIPEPQDHCVHCIECRERAEEVNQGIEKYFSKWLNLKSKLR